LKFSFAVGLAAVSFTALCCAAQNAPSAPTAPPQPADAPSGKVIFSRSTDENGQTTTQATPSASLPAIEMVKAPSAEDAERQAVRYVGLDLDVRLRPAERHIAVRALLTVRNDGKTPLARIPLQISSSLDWERIRVIGPAGQGKDIGFQVATLNSDADHTGQLHEAAPLLAQPLPPGASLDLDVTYSGTIAASAQRLLTIGTPEDAALASDWDRIGVDFTGLRGFGNVVWYPATSVPAILGDGARLFDAIGEHKLRLSGARFRLRLTVEFPRGQAPTVAVVNGHALPMKVGESGGLDQSQEVDGVATADSGSATLGFEAPSLFVAIRVPHLDKNLIAWTLADDNAAVQDWSAAAAAVTPFLEGWLGPRPRSQLTLLDLPDPLDAPFESGSLLAAPMREAGQKSYSDRLNGILVHALTHAWLSAPNAPQPLPAWLNEGVAAFMGTLWIEKRQGREQALRILEADRAALALAEPESPGQSAGQPLAAAISPVYYRAKAAYVLWMLRDLAGDAALRAALRAYNADDGASALNGGKPLEKSAVRSTSTFQKLLEESGARRDLSWFFADWIDADKGLPDLSIDGVFPTVASAGNWLVSVNVSNSGYAAAEVPVTVRSADTSVTERLQVSARGKAVQRILIQSKPVEVQVNDGTVPETQASVHIFSTR